MARTDKNPRRYTLHVYEVQAVPGPEVKGPEIVIVIPGKLSQRAKRELRRAIDDQAVTIEERVIA